MKKTDRLKQELWKRFGSLEHPAEWDGNVYGGGKLSQRYWEYLKAIELLNLDENSVVLDIGGGSPVTGMGFFSALLASCAKKVIVMDSSINADTTPPSNVEFIRKHSSYDELKSLLSARPDITHIVSISVFEHIEPLVREAMITSINDFFHGTAIVATFEYHAKTSHFEHVLTAKTVSDLFKPFTKFYLDDFFASPVLCENSLDHSRILRLYNSSLRRMFTFGDIPRWCPVAVRFLKAAV